MSSALLPTRFVIPDGGLSRVSHETPLLASAFDERPAGGHDANALRGGPKRERWLGLRIDRSDHDPLVRDAAEDQPGSRQHPNVLVLIDVEEQELLRSRE